MASSCVSWRRLESSLDSEEIKPVNLKGNQHWMLTGTIDTEVPIFWSPDINSQLIGKVPDAGKVWGLKKKRASKDKMAGWHHWCNEPEVGQTSGDGEEHGGLACYSPWGQKESDRTGRLNNSGIPFYSPSLLTRVLPKAHLTLHFRMSSICLKPIRNSKYEGKILFIYLFLFNIQKANKEKVYHVN